MFSQRIFFPLGLSQVYTAGKDSRMQMNVASQFDIVQDGHVGKEFDILKGSGDTQFRYLMRFATGQLGIFKIDGTCLGMIKAIDAIQQGGLSGAVGAYNRKDLTLLYACAHAVQRFQTPKAEMNIIYSQLIVASIHGRFTP
jgi:hypothetical protein